MLIGQSKSPVLKEITPAQPAGGSAKAHQPLRYPEKPPKSQDFQPISFVRRRKQGFLRKGSPPGARKNFCKLRAFGLGVPLIGTKGAD
jgi:hypothetical protein